jgi:hypothetical protein
MVPIPPVSLRPLAQRCTALQDVFASLNLGNPDNSRSFLTPFFAGFPDRGNGIVYQKVKINHLKKPMKHGQDVSQRAITPQNRPFSNIDDIIANTIASSIPYCIFLLSEYRPTYPQFVVPKKFPTLEFLRSSRDLYSNFSDPEKVRCSV